MDPAIWLALLAQVRASPLGMSRLGALAAGLSLGVLAIWWYSRIRDTPRKEHAPQSPQQLMHELCRAHRLSAAQERLLEWVVNDRQLTHPAMLFLDPLLLERAISRSDAPGVRKRLTDLRSKLFAGALGLGGAPS